MVAVAVVATDQSEFYASNIIPADSGNATSDGYSSNPKTLFRRDIRWDELLYQSHSQRFDKMQENGQIFSGSEVFQFAHEMKTAMEIRGISSYNYQQFLNIKNKLPDCVRIIIWSNTVTIADGNKYFYAATNGMAFDSDRRNVYVWRESFVTHDDQKWQFYTFDGGKTFVIRNKHFNEHLYAASYKPYSDERRRVFTWRDESTDYTDTRNFWVLEVSSSSQIRIKNKHFGEYLYADMENDSNRMVVNTYRKGNKAFYWTIRERNN